VACGSPPAVTTASHQRDDGLLHGLVDLLTCTASSTSCRPARPRQPRHGVPPARPRLRRASTDRRPVLLSGGSPSGPTNPTGRGSGGGTDPVAGMEAGGGAGERWAGWVWGCRPGPEPGGCHPESRYIDGRHKGWSWGDSKTHLGFCTPPPLPSRQRRRRSASSLMPLGALVACMGRV
jgi:hypothetical protein